LSWGLKHQEPLDIRAETIHQALRTDHLEATLVGVSAFGETTRAAVGIIREPNHQIAEKELLACSHGYRESTESWAGVLRDLKNLGMTAPMVAVGDGALGFWSALGDVFPETAEQRCWVHATANILDALPKRLHRAAKAAIHKIYQAEIRSDADAGIDDFVRVYGDKYPKAVAKLTRNRDVLLTFYDYPAVHWVHLRTTNPIESTFAAVRARTRVTNGTGSRRRGLVMAYKLLDAAEDRWRKVNSPELVVQVRAGIEFKDGIRVERSTDKSRDAA